MKSSLLLCALSVVCLAVHGATAQEPPKARNKAAGRQSAAFVLPEGVRIEPNIVYAKYGDRAVMLDLYLPKRPPATTLPCIVVIHGGGWRSGDKQRFARQAAYLADHGFAAACIGYRLLPEVTIAECVQDTKAAVRWVRANAARYKINPGQIGTIGGSAGGHLVALLGTSAKAEKLEGSGGNPGVSSRVQAVVAMAAVTDFTAFAGRMEMSAETAKLLSPVTYVDAQSAPLLLLHGDADRTVPLAQSEILLKKYQAAGAFAELVVVKDGPHGFWNTAGFTDTMDRAVAFFRASLKESPRATTAER